jgi:transposase
MKFKHVIGFDMAKDSFTLHVHDFIFKGQFLNTPKEIRKMLKTLAQVLKCSLDQCLFCLEHTGLYSLEMMIELSKQELHFSVIPGLELRKSQGITRGKSDPIDAAQIAAYADLRKEKMKLYRFPSKALIELQYLLSLRAKHVRTRASYQQRLTEQFRILKKTHFPKIYRSQKKIIDQLKKEIAQVDQLIMEVIESELELKECFELLQSIKGVGPILSAQMIVKTEYFQAFSNWRKFACYCGTAPFPNESGKQKKTYRISKIGNSEMKTLLTLSARTAILHDPEIKTYYQRKLSQGKSKKCITNAVRNKLLARMFSVVKRGTPFVQLYNFAC